MAFPLFFHDKYYPPPSSLMDFVLSFLLWAENIVVITFFACYFSLQVVDRLFFFQKYAYEKRGSDSKKDNRFTITITDKDIT